MGGSRVDYYRNNRYSRRKIIEKMRHFVLHILFLSAALSVVAVSPSFAAGMTSPLDPEVKSVIDKAFSFERLTASYRMVRTVPVISGYLESSGSMELYGDGSLYWRCESPDEYEFFTDGNSAYVEEDGRKMAVPQAFSSIFSMISDARGSLEDNEMFSIVTQEMDGERIGLEILPSRGALSSFISKIDMVLSITEAVVAEVNILASNGSVTRIVFKDVVKL